MKLWLLRPRNDLKDDNPWEPWYDRTFGFVIRADTEISARKMADADSIGDESRHHAHPWLNPEYSTCTELTLDGPAEVIIKDFAAA